VSRVYRPTRHNTGNFGGGDFSEGSGWCMPGTLQGGWPAVCSLSRQSRPSQQLITSQPTWPSCFLPI